MVAHAMLVAFLALGAAARAQAASVWVDVEDSTEEAEEVEKRYTPELVKELQLAKDDALLLFTEYTGRAGLELQLFIREIRGFANKTVSALDADTFQNAAESCRHELMKKLFKLEHDTALAASFTGVNHHKFMLGHMVVFRMHFNKCDEYIKKCDKVISRCGIACETTPQVRRWRRHAADELHRVQDDMQHTRLSYKDLLKHAHKQHIHLRKQAASKAQHITNSFLACT